MIQFKVRHETLGNHVHCQLFTRKLPTHTWAKCGNFTMTVEDFKAYKALHPEKAQLYYEHWGDDGNADANTATAKDDKTPEVGS